MCVRLFDSIFLVGVVVVVFLCQSLYTESITHLIKSHFIDDVLSIILNWLRFVAICSQVITSKWMAYLPSMWNQNIPLPNAYCTHCAHTHYKLRSMKLRMILYSIPMRWMLDASTKQNQYCFSFIRKHKIESNSNNNSSSNNYAENGTKITDATS